MNQKTKNRIISFFFTILLLVIFNFLLIITQPETTPLWVRILVIIVPLLNICDSIIVKKLIREERGSRYLKNTDRTLDKENQKIKRQEMNRSIKRIKKIRNIGVFFCILLGVIFVFLLFITQWENDPLWVRILAIVPIIVIWSHIPKANKLLREERRRRFLEETDEEFDKENLVNEQKAILKDLKKEHNGNDESSEKIYERT